MEFFSNEKSKNKNNQNKIKKYPCSLNGFCSQKYTGVQHEQKQNQQN